MAEPLFADRPDDRVQFVRATEMRQDPARQAYQLLYFAFVLVPLLAGVDKFFHVLVNWDQYLSPTFARISPVAPHTLMLAVGVVEIVAGLLVAARPAVFAYVVTAWLWAIIVNLLLVPGYYDIALRDFGLSLGALALARLAQRYDPANGARSAVSPRFRPVR